jgi:hypothetical protein
MLSCGRQWGLGVLVIPLSPAKAGAQIQPEHLGGAPSDRAGSSELYGFNLGPGLRREERIVAKIYFAAARSAAKPALAATVVRNVPQAMSARVMVVDHTFSVAWLVRS